MKNQLMDRKVNLDAPIEGVEKDSMVTYSFLFGLLLGSVLTVCFILIYNLIKNIINGVVKLW
jgi:hypothetical protein